jgi:hypothetical protein
MKSSDDQLRLQSKSNLFLETNCYDVSSAANAQRMFKAGVYGFF